MASALATLAQLKEYIGNSADATDDALLTRLLNNAAELLERSCNRIFAQATYTETRDGLGGLHMAFNNRPITGVTSLTVNGRTIPQSTGPIMSGWYIAAPWRIALRGYDYRFEQGMGNVVVTYTAGFATIPDDLTQACILLASLMYKERDRMGLDSKTVGGESISFTKDDLPPSVQQVIHNYRNVFYAL